MENHNTSGTRLPLSALVQHQRMWLFSGVCGTFACGVAAPDLSTSRGTASPHVARRLWTLEFQSLRLGIRPSHQRTMRYSAFQKSLKRVPSVTSLIPWKVQSSVGLDQVLSCDTTGMWNLRRIAVLLC
ncbi:uncharacterized protein LOC144240248 [Crocuta crocuta]